ncbi:MAG TPA: hypothetical protein DIW77_10365 [Chromatiaceae bacterium]|nr:hypothetical protein [Chromatiaceae bacterium]
MAWVSPADSFVTAIGVGIGIGHPNLRS